MPPGLLVYSGPPNRATQVDSTHLDECHDSEVAVELPVLPNHERRHFLNELPIPLLLPISQTGALEASGHLLLTDNYDISLKT